MIFGKWRPVPAMLACLMFGFLQALAIRLQGYEFPVIGEVPGEFVQALPYILTVVLLAGFIGKAIAPKAIGVPFVKRALKCAWLVKTNPTARLSESLGKY